MTAFLSFFFNAFDSFGIIFWNTSMRFDSSRFVASSFLSLTSLRPFLPCLQGQGAPCHRVPRGVQHRRLPVYRGGRAALEGRLLPSHVPHLGTPAGELEGQQG